MASRGGFLSTVKCLIEVGAYLQAKTQTGLTALHAAAISGKSEVIKCLHENGADISAKDDKGMTPLHKYDQFHK